MAYPEHPVRQLTSDYQASPSEIMLFVDESGDARMNDPGNRLFALAACVTLGASMDRVAEQWRQVRRSTLGDPDKPLHFTDLARRLSVGRRQKVLAEFFDDADIGRIGVCIGETQGFNLCAASGRLVIQAAFDELLIQEVKTLGRDVEKITIVFEDGAMMRHVYKLCKGLQCIKSDGSEVELNFIFTNKNPNVPFLEIADGISHTTAGYCRSNGQNYKFVNRSRAIFEPSNGAPAVMRDLIANFSRSDGSLQMNVSERVR